MAEVERFLIGSAMMTFLVAAASMRSTMGAGSGRKW
jgi:hypothetical protein